MKTLLEAQTKGFLFLHFGAKLCFESSQFESGLFFFISPFFPLQIAKLTKRLAVNAINKHVFIPPFAHSLSSDIHASKGKLVPETIAFHLPLDYVSGVALFPFHLALSIFQPSGMWALVLQLTA